MGELAHAVPRITVLRSDNKILHLSSLSAACGADEAAVLVGGEGEIVEEVELAVESAGEIAEGSPGDAGHIDVFAKESDVFSSKGSRVPGLQFSHILDIPATGAYAGHAEGTEIKTGIADHQLGG